MMSKVMTETNKQWISKTIDHASRDIGIDVTSYKEKCLRTISVNMDQEKIIEILIKNPIENIDEARTNWTFLARRLKLKQLYQQAADHRGYTSEEKYSDFHQLLTLLTNKGIYSPCLLNTYTVEDITYFANELKPERDLLFDYLGLYTFATRY